MRDPSPALPRYAILTHDHPFPHWDFLLEEVTVLHAWRLLEEPREGASIPAESIPDHRPFYLDYEGPVSGGRGTVRQWDAGEYALQPGNNLCVTLSGRRGLSQARLTGGPDALTWTFGS
jgi:hypothetical protein